MFRSVAIAGLFLWAAGTLPAQDKPKNPKDDPSQIGARDVGRGINFYSFAKEMALGKQLAAEVVRQAKVVDDPIISEYVNRMGQNLVRNSDAKFPFTFQVIESNVPNAFALPGGYVFVHTGLIKMADEEAELAAAIAHEIAHGAARHMTRQATKRQIVSYGSVPLVFMGGWIGAGAQSLLPLAYQGFSRQDESEADFLGLQYLYAAGYDPNSAVTLFEKMASLERKQLGLLDRVLSTHPSDTARLEKVQQEIGRILPARAEYVVNTSTYTVMRERLFRLQESTQDKQKKSPPTLQNRSGRE